MRVKLTRPAQRAAEGEAERRRRTSRPGPALSGPAAALFRLQRERGNLVARELVQRQNRPPGEEEEEEPLIQRQALGGPAPRAQRG